MNNKNTPPPYIKGRRRFLNIEKPKESVEITIRDVGGSYSQDQRWYVYSSKAVKKDTKVTVLAYYNDCFDGITKWDFFTATISYGDKQSNCVLEYHMDEDSCYQSGNWVYCAYIYSIDDNDYQTFIIPDYTFVRLSLKLVQEATYSVRLSKPVDVDIVFSAYCGIAAFNQTATILAGDSSANVSIILSPNHTWTYATNYDYFSTPKGFVIYHFLV